jgi:hypothetical protein
MNALCIKTVVTLLALFAAGVFQTKNEGPKRSEFQSADLSDSIWKGSQITYVDLFRKILPDLKNDSNVEDHAIAHKSIPLRSLSGDGDAVALESDIKISDFEMRRIRSEGNSLLLLRADLSAEDANQSTPYEGEVTLIAVFRIEPKLELLDAIDIKTDRFSGFWGKTPVLRLNPLNDAFIVYSTHWNAGESYNDISVLFVDRGRLRVITNQFIYNTQGCGVTFTETPFFQASPAAGRKYPNLLVSVKLKKDADPENCSRRTPGFIRYYRALYQWNSVKAEYEADTRQLDRLEKFNKQRL